jgi:hypothetical protein
VLGAVCTFVAILKEYRKCGVASQGSWLDAKQSPATPPHHVEQKLDAKWDRGTAPVSAHLNVKPQCSYEAKQSCRAVSNAVVLDR